MSLSETSRFLRAFFAHPGTIGAVAASSRKLAQAMVDQTLQPTDHVIVEYGPGTGAFTQEILSRKSPDATFLAIELHTDFADLFQQRYPGVTLCRDSVENLPSILQHRRLDAVDCIVSGLPWAVFADDLQDRILDVTCASLAPDGRFATFAYVQGLALPAAQRFAAKLRQRFQHVSRSPVVWRNLPPALVYRCRKSPA